MECTTTNNQEVMECTTTNNQEAMECTTTNNQEAGYGMHFRKHLGSYECTTTDNETKSRRRPKTHLFSE